MTDDNVNHPSHYNSGKIEVIEAVEDWGLGYHCGNAVKYTARAGKKDPKKEVEDLKKAVWYLKRQIEILEASKENREVVRPNSMNLPSISVTDASPSSARQPATTCAKTAQMDLHIGGYIRGTEGLEHFNGS